MSLPITRTEPLRACLLWADVNSQEFPMSWIGGANNRIGDAAASCELKAAFATPGLPKSPNK